MVEIAIDLRLPPDLWVGLASECTTVGIVVLEVGGVVKEGSAVEGRD